MKTKKGQLKMFESMGVMIVFFFLLAFGMNFYFYVQESTIQKDLYKFEQMRAVHVAVNAQFLPELDCSYGGGDITQKCIDEERLNAIIQITSDTTTPQLKERLKTVFGYANINISIMDKTTQKFGPDITIYNLQKNDAGYQTFTMPVVVCDESCQSSPSRHYSFALLKVRTYG